MKRILVVDDDCVTRHLLRRVLTKEGFAVATAPHGAQALRQMQKKKFALLLLDIWMPRLNGLEVLAELRKTGAHPRVIVMTTDTTPETVLRAVREQAYQYLNKPINVKALVELVHGGWPLPRPCLPLRCFRAGRNGSSSSCPANSLQPTGSRVFSPASHRI